MVCGSPERAMIILTIYKLGTVGSRNDLSGGKTSFSPETASSLVSDSHFDPGYLMPNMPGMLHTLRQDQSLKMMGDSKEQKVRWKGRHACETALSDSMSAIYNAIKEWTPPSGMFADSAVLLPVNYEQAQLLNRACFGRPYPPAIAPPAASSPTYPPPIPGFDDSDSKEGLQIFQLSMEEAFFLSHEMKCIKIYHQTSKEVKVLLSDDELWRVMLKKKQQFVQHYKAFSHMRSKRWVVLSGIQFGADFMAYRHHPALVHSDYAVLVMSGEEKQSRINTWTELHAMGRLCGSVAKTLLLMYVKRKDAAVDSTSPSCLEEFDVEAVEVNRWLPEKNREADDNLEENSETG